MENKVVITADVRIEHRLQFNGPRCLIYRPKRAPPLRSGCNSDSGIGAVGQTRQTPPKDVLVIYAHVRKAGCIYHVSWVSCVLSSLEVVVR